MLLSFGLNLNASEISQETTIDEELNEGDKKPSMIVHRKTSLIFELLDSIQYLNPIQKE